MYIKYNHDRYWYCSCTKYLSLHRLVGYPGNYTKIFGLRAEEVNKKKLWWKTSHLNLKPLCKISQIYSKYQKLSRLWRKQLLISCRVFIFLFGFALVKLKVKGARHGLQILQRFSLHFSLHRLLCVLIFSIFKHTCSFIVYYRLSGVSLSNKTTVFRLPSVLR